MVALTESERSIARRVAAGRAQYRWVLTGMSRFLLAAVLMGVSSDDIGSLERDSGIVKWAPVIRIEGRRMTFLRQPQRQGVRATPERAPREPASVRERLVAAYRRTGADVPFGDPLPSHGSEMEGWFWRLTDPAQGRVVVALCSENRHPEGNWSTAAIALHPGGIVRSSAIDGVRADRTRFSVQADSGGDLIDASRDRLRMVLGDTPPGAADRRRVEVDL